jgi:hypothetical protein
MVYKFDHAPDADGFWHPLRRGSTAQYRIAQDRLQIVSPENDAAIADFDSILALIGSATPLGDADLGAVDITITRVPDGFLVRSPSDFDQHPQGLTIPALTPEDLTRAVGRLRVGDR